MASKIDKIKDEEISLIGVKFPQMYVTVCEKKEGGEKCLILTPEQGLDYMYVNSKEDISKYEKIAFFTTDVELTSDGKSYNALTPLKKVSTPSTVDVKKQSEKVKKIKEELKEALVEQREQEKENFKKDNNIPPRPSELFIPDEVWNFSCASLKLNKYVIFLGPTGCGKSQTAQSLANAMKMKYITFNMGAAFKPKQMFVGAMTAQHGDTVFVESEFLKAFQSEEPTLMFLDEITRIPQAASNYLMTILDRLQSYIYIEELGKRIYKGKGIKFVCAGNVGMQYTDTRTLDGAFWDRFVKLPINYLKPEKEVELILQRQPKAAKKQIELLVEKAGKCRLAEEAGTLATGISTRQLLDMADYLAAGFSVEEVMENVFLNNFINGNTNEIEQAKAILQS